MSSVAFLSESQRTLSKYLIDCISAGDLNDGLTVPKLIKLGQAARSITVVDRKTDCHCAGVALEYAIG